MGIKSSYFYLNNLNIAYNRVETRIKLGGHAVTKEEIKERFELGFKQLNKALRLCDYISIFDYSIDYKPEIIISWSASKLKLHKKVPLHLIQKVPNILALGIPESMIEKDT